SNCCAKGRNRPRSVLDESDHDRVYSGLADPGFACGPASWNCPSSAANLVADARSDVRNCGPYRSRPDFQFAVVPFSKPMAEGTGLRHRYRSSTGCVRVLVRGDLLLDWILNRHGVSSVAYGPSTPKSLLAHQAIRRRIGGAHPIDDLVGFWRVFQFDADRSV